MNQVLRMYVNSSPFEKEILINNSDVQECVYYNYYDRHLRILAQRNIALRERNHRHGGFVRLNYIDEVDEERIAGSV